MAPKIGSKTYLAESGALVEMPDALRNYMNFEAFVRDARLNGVLFVTHREGDVWIFSPRQKDHSTGPASKADSKRSQKGP